MGCMPQQIYFLLLLIGPLWIGIENYFHFQPLFCHVMQKAYVERDESLTCFSSGKNYTLDYSPLSSIQLFTIIMHGDF